MDLTAIAAVNATRAHVLSARPDAPVVPDPPRRPRRTDPLRRTTATALRRLAEQVEPRRPARQPAEAGC